MKLLPLFFGLLLAAPAASAHPRNYYHYHDWGSIERNSKRTSTRYDWKHCKKIKKTTWMSPHGRQERRKVTRLPNCGVWHRHYHHDHDYHDHGDNFWFGVRVRVD